MSSKRGFTLIVLSLIASGTFALAQTNGSYNAQTGRSASAQTASVSAESVRPGSLNYVEGQVSSDGQPLDPQAVGHFALRPGQALHTATGYAEVLLTPGAFLRVGQNSEISLTAVGLGDTRVNLTRGSALIEADQILDGIHLEVTLGSTSVDVLKKGLYEFSADPADVKVFEGKADVIGLTTHRQVGKHDQILFANNANLKKTSFDQKQAKDAALYVWSEARSREEAAQNKLVAQNSSGYAPVGGGWFWDPYANYYGFWPQDSFYSPFGFGFLGGFYPGFYGGYYGGYGGGFFGGGRGFVGGRHFVGGARTFSGFHGNGVAGGFHGGGGGFHAGGGHR